MRADQHLNVSGGALRIPAPRATSTAPATTRRTWSCATRPTGPGTATTKVNFQGTVQYHQAGIIVYGDDANFTKFGRIAHTAAGDEKFEFIYENAGTPRNDAADSTANMAADFPTTSTCASRPTGRT